MSRIVSLQIDGRPKLLNAERAGHWRDHRSSTQLTRKEAWVRLIPEGKKGMMARVKVDVYPYYADRRLPDTAACLPTVKAIIDGAVDARLLENDGPAVVRYVGFWAPRTDVAVGNTLLVTFEELDDGSPWSQEQP